jgi:hypothetical protein
MTRLMLTAVALAMSGAALAKLPPPDEATKAKAAETTAKSAWQAKVDAFQLCKAQDRVVAGYKKTAATKPAASASAAASAPAAAAAPANAAPVPTPASASQGGSTPVAAIAPVAAPPAPCADPGPFAYAPPDQKPLESSGAHSPAATAASPPSVRPPAAEMTPSKPSVAPAKPAATTKP